MSWKKGEFPLKRNNTMLTVENINQNLMLEAENRQGFSLMRTIIVRHGDPIDRFDEKTKLSPQGEKQFEGFVGSLLARLDARPILPNGNKKPLRIVIDDTDAPRAIQCGIMAKLMVNFYILDRGAQEWLSVEYRGNNKALRPQGAFKPLIDFGIPKERVPEEYLTSPDELNEKRGANPRHKVARSLLQETQNMVRMYAGLYPGHDILYLVVNHEAGIGSIVKTWFPNQDWHVRPTEAVTVDFRPDDWKEIEFRGQKILVPPTHGGMKSILIESSLSRSSSITN